MFSVRAKEREVGKIFLPFLVGLEDWGNLTVFMRTYIASFVLVKIVGIYFSFFIF